MSNPSYTYLEEDDTGYLEWSYSALKFYDKIRFGFSVEPDGKLYWYVVALHRGEDGAEFDICEDGEVPQEFIEQLLQANGCKEPVDGLC